jgi:uncharacterized protein with FMN-binding domain
MKRFLKIGLTILVVLILVAGGGIFYMSRGVNSGAKLQINKIELSTAKDGTYNGKYSSGRWTNELGVVVKDHKITKIDIIKDVSFKVPEVTKQIFDRVIAKQNTDIDVVSGSTVTSKAYLKSIENAFKK